MFSVRQKLSTMMFMESFIFGAWFVPLWQFLSSNGFTPSEIAWSYACTAIASLISPLFIGAIADRFFSAQKVLSILMFAGAALMFMAAQQTEFTGFFIFLMLYAMTYMPTIALANSITFSNVSNVEQDFPRIRVLGTIGWIFSGIVCGFVPTWLGFGDISSSNVPLLVSALGSLCLGAFSLMLPNTPPSKKSSASLKELFGLDSLVLLKDRSFLVFFFVSFMFSVPISFYYTFANGYLTEVGLDNATGWMSLGQFSEIFFMLSLPFFIKRFGIRKVLLAGLFTAALRYGLFAFANAEIWYMTSMLFAGILLHGISYDLFFVTGFIYVDKKADNKIRTAAQGLLVLACNGIGQLLGYNIGGALMEKIFTYAEPVNGLTFNWSGMWIFGAIFIAIIFVIFFLFFQEDKHELTKIDAPQQDIDVRYTRSEV